jgi:hypothetical protein
MDGKRAPDAYFDASGTPPPNGGKTPLNAGNTPETGQRLIDCLIKAQGVLLEYENEIPGSARSGIATILDDATALARALWKTAKRSESPVEKRLANIELLLSKTAGTQPASTQPANKGLWAAVAAKAISREAAPIAQRPAVRVRMPDVAGKTNPEILTAVRTVIRGAYAIKPMRSGDIEVLVPDQAAKDHALNQASIDGVKILRQDYPVEIPAVPLSLKVDSGKTADNQALIQELIKENKRRIPTLAINKIQWLPTPKTLEKRIAQGKKRSTLIISAPTQAIQHELVNKGLILEAQLYEANIWNHGIEAKLCYRCNGWGHTQAACGKDPRCGKCADKHQTKDCDQTTRSCVNCGRAHCAWQKALCRTYKAYSEGLLAKRATAHTATLAIRQQNAGRKIANIQTDGFTIVQSKKRGRSPPAQSTQSTQATQPVRKVGRPTNYATAAREATRDPTQIRFELSQISTLTPSTSASGELEGSILDEIMEDINNETEF